MGAEAIVGCVQVGLIIIILAFGNSKKKKKEVTAGLQQYIGDFDPRIKFSSAHNQSLPSRNTRPLIIISQWVAAFFDALEGIIAYPFYQLQCGATTHG